MSEGIGLYMDGYIVSAGGDDRLYYEVTIDAEVSLGDSKTEKGAYLEAAKNLKKLAKKAKRRASKL